MDGINVIAIIQHHGMYIEDLCINLADFFERFLIQCMQLIDRFLFCVLKTRYLRFGILDLSS